MGTYWGLGGETDRRAPLWELVVHLCVAPRHTDPSAGLHLVTVQHKFMRYLQLLGRRELTACIRASDREPPFVTATALPLMSASDFCLFTTIWDDDPKELEAGRFPADILAVVIVGGGI